ncbi:hypothetical protein NCC49_005155 [Naganishia albida]|nr:hypothetical protein NCC49_005155 [Naganishia albida]
MENVIRALSAPGVRDEVGCPLLRSGQMQQAWRTGERISPLPGFFQMRWGLDRRRTYLGKRTMGPTIRHVPMSSLEISSARRLLDRGLEQQIRWCPRIAHDEDEHVHDVAPEYGELEDQQYMPHLALPCIMSTAASNTALESCRTSPSM